MKSDAQFTVPRDASGAVRRPVLIFDGACGFCTWTVHRLAATIDRLGRVAYAPSQALAATDFAELGVDPTRCMREAVFVDVRGRVTGGADAVNAYLRAAGGAPTRAAAALLGAPPLRALESAVYRCVARHRIAISRVLGTAKYALYDVDRDR